MKQARREEREAAITAWWGSLDQQTLDIGDRRIDRLYSAFHKVVRCLDDEQFLRVDSMQAICLPATRGKVFRTLEGSVAIFFDGYKTFRARDLVSLVAHEVAHVVLGHHDDGYGGAHSNADAERQADDLVESWGLDVHIAAAPLRPCKQGRIELVARSVFGLMTSAAWSHWAIPGSISRSE